ETMQVLHLDELAHAGYDRQEAPWRRRPDRDPDRLDLEGAEPRRWPRAADLGLAQLLGCPREAATEFGEERRVRAKAARAAPVGEGAATRSAPVPWDQLAFTLSTCAPGMPKDGGATGWDAAWIGCCAGVPPRSFGAAAWSK